MLISDGADKAERAQTNPRGEVQTGFLPPLPAPAAFQNSCLTCMNSVKSEN